eukprot:Awhi_evm1s15270
MALELYNDKVKVASLNDNDSCLSDYEAIDDYVLHVTGEKLSDLQDDSVEKYEMEDKDYDKIKGTVRDFKRNLQIGRFSPDADAQQELLEKQGEVEAQKIKVGDRCEVRNVPGYPTRRGSVKFVGKTKFSQGFWVGVQYDEPMGKNDGSVQGERYFTCPKNYGGFVRPQSVVVGDFPEIGFSDDDEF